MERELWAIKSPSGLLIAWTCFPSSDAAWLEYTGLNPGNPYLQKRINDMKAQGYRVVRVQLTEIEEPALSSTGKET